MGKGAAHAVGNLIAGKGEKEARALAMSTDIGLDIAYRLGQTILVDADEGLRADLLATDEGRFDRLLSGRRIEIGEAKRLLTRLETESDAGWNRERLSKLISAELKRADEEAQKYGNYILNSLERTK